MLSARLAAFSSITQTQAHRANNASDINAPVILLSLHPLPHHTSFFLLGFWGLILGHHGFKGVGGGRRRWTGREIGVPQCIPVEVRGQLCEVGPIPPLYSVVI